MKEMETKYFPNYPGAITSGCGGGYVLLFRENEVRIKSGLGANKIQKG